MRLGSLPDGSAVGNHANFPSGDVHEQAGRWIYEVPNPFPFHGATYIDSGWADARARDPGMIRIDPPQECSLLRFLAGIVEPEAMQEAFSRLPQPVRHALAASSTDPEELVLLARSCCRIEFDESGLPTGLRHVRSDREMRPDVDDFELFEAVANNPFLPDSYKQVMALRPGVQGRSEIVGRSARGSAHAFEYLRRNSYIPWGHYAANMAHDAIRYRASELSSDDIGSLRRLYFQRMTVVLAEQLGVRTDLPRRRSLTDQELEDLRKEALAAAAAGGRHPATLWGWNFGYDFSSSGYRLHASHQMVHQQHAVVPDDVELLDGGRMPSYSFGDQAAETAAQYRLECGGDFFDDYLRCIRQNERIDRDPQKEASLIVHEDENVLLFVPKAQTSQWELQLMVVADQTDGRPVGNMLEAEPAVRESIDQGILQAQHVLARMGATMVTSIECSKRIGIRNGQRLLYAFLPKLPWSMGAFSEAQHRCVGSHFPEDFARACRRQKTGR